jgi:inosine-uridine nucleoside N-ribohydrolase
MDQGWARRAMAVLVAAGVLVTAACAGSGRGQTAQPEPVPVVVDTDMAADDILALLYLLGRPDVRVVGVTVVGDGIVHARPGADNARAVLAAAGHADVPVAYGSEQPLRGTAAFPNAWRTQADERYGMADLWPVPQTGAALGNDAVSLLSSLAGKYPGLRILALGPLTSVALALRRPAVRATHPRVIVSGGAVAEPGNMPASNRAFPVAEWNVGIDPAAADEVLRSGLATDWVPLDATNQVPADIWFVRALAAQPRNRVGDAALALLQHNAALSRGGFYFWDPAAAVALTTPAAFTLRSLGLDVITDGPDAGRTLQDSAGTTVRLAAAAHPAAVDSALLAGFSTGGAMPTFAAGRADVNVLQRTGSFSLDSPARLPAGDVSLGLDATTGSGFVVAIGRLTGGHDYADVVAAVRHGATAAPAWFVVEVTADVPAGSRPTWIVALPTGTHVILAARRDGTGITALGQLTT